MEVQLCSTICVSICVCLTVINLNLEHKMRQMNMISEWDRKPMIIWVWKLNLTYFWTFNKNKILYCNTFNELESYLFVVSLKLNWGRLNIHGNQPIFNVRHFVQVHSAGRAGHDPRSPCWIRIIILFFIAHERITIKNKQTKNKRNSYWIDCWWLFHWTLYIVHVLPHNINQNVSTSVDFVRFFIWRSINDVTSPCWPTAFPHGTGVRWWCQCHTSCFTTSQPQKKNIVYLKMFSESFYLIIFFHVFFPCFFFV